VGRIEPGRPIITTEHESHSDSAKNISLAFFLNLSFTLLEIIGGLWTNSVAVLSDALHDLGDSISLGLAWYLERYSQRASDRSYSYGYGRFSLLGALINSAILIGGSLYILSQAVPRLFAPEATYAPGMLLMAIVGIAVNGLAVLRLKRSHSLNVQVVTWHLLEDVLGWVAVLLVSIILLFTQVYILDPILSILITLYVLYNVLTRLKKTMVLFLQGVPENIDLPAFEQHVLALDKVQSTHHTHVWSLNGDDHVLSTHVVLDNSTTREESIQVKNAVKALTENLNIQHITVEIEYEEATCEKVAQRFH
jgi:cobalt-zinc-cadmium efflux system protein